MDDLRGKILPGNSMGFYPQIHVGFDHSGTLIPSKWGLFFGETIHDHQWIVSRENLNRKVHSFCLPSKSKGAPVNLPLI